MVRAKNGKAADRAVENRECRECAHACLLACGEQRPSLGVRPRLHLVWASLLLSAHVPSWLVSWWGFSWLQFLSCSWDYRCVPRRPRDLASFQEIPETFQYQHWYDKPGHDDICGRLATPQNHRCSSQPQTNGFPRPPHHEQPWRSGFCSHAFIVSRTSCVAWDGHSWLLADTCDYDYDSGKACV